MTRRSFLEIGTVGGALVASPRVARGIRNCVSEWTIASSKRYPDPFNDVEVDFVFSGPGGKEWRVPAFWAGEQNWTVRFAPPEAGSYRFRSICSDTANSDLHDIAGNLDVGDYEGQNILYKRGGLRVASDRRHLEHGDGTPFFWLADTWWGALVKRFRWPEDFEFLTADRVRKGFTAIQLAAAFPPIMDPFDSRAEGDGGYPWEKGFTRINPAYWDMADLRLRHLVERGLVPCVFGGWGYTILMTGVEKMKKHWRHIVARWGAYPVVWCLCGEVDLPWYTSTNKAEERDQQIKGWIEVGHHLRKVDPYHRLVTIHPVTAGRTGRNALRDAPVLDFDMLQTGHPMVLSIRQTVPWVRETAAKENPRMPVLVGEVCYEGVFGESPAYHQRYLFWSSILSGALVGHTYGAAGIWEVNTDDIKAGIAPGGINWGETPWREASGYPGSGQLHFSKELLMRYPWWRLETHMDWIEPHWNNEPYALPFAAGIPGELRIFYVPSARPPLPKLCGLESGLRYRASLMDPSTGRRFPLPDVQGDAKSECQLGAPPAIHDWVLVLEAMERR